MPLRRLRLPVLTAALLALIGCSNPAIAPNPTAPNYIGGPAVDPATGTGHASQGNVLNDLFGGGSKKPSANAGSPIAVNAYLWRGTLDTLSFMPLASADPFGGIIITDWYSPPAAPDERFKATAYILGRELRADALKLSMFHQLYQGGRWVDAPVSADTVGDIEAKILDRARQLRIETASR
ncbi:MAG: DUF3576 domain-containing protein [Acetobacteraceae bacterium]